MSGRPCEVCSALASSDTDGLGSPTLATERSARTRRVLVEDRLLALCDEHAAELHLRNVTRLSELREVFRERLGQRSLLDQRAPLDRRVFPPRPEGRRRSDGRRSTDSEA